MASLPRELVGYGVRFAGKKGERMSAFEPIHRQGSQPRAPHGRHRRLSGDRQICSRKVIPEILGNQQHQPDIQHAEITHFSRSAEEKEKRQIDRDGDLEVSTDSIAQSTEAAPNDYRE